MRETLRLMLEREAGLLASCNENTVDVEYQLDMFERVPSIIEGSYWQAHKLHEINRDGMQYAVYRLLVDARKRKEDSRRVQSS